MAKHFRSSPSDLARRLHPLATKRYLVRISDSRYYLPDELLKLAELVASLGETGAFTVREFRDAAEIGRNVAIEVLEYFDGVGFTRREQNTRLASSPVGRAAFKAVEVRIRAWWVRLLPLPPDPH